MATVTWVPDSDGGWRTPADWSTLRLPGTADSVFLATPDPHTITHSISGDSIGSLTATTDTLAVTGGSLKVVGTASLAAGLILGGGTLNLAGGGNITGGMTASGGTLAIAAGATVMVAGTASLGGGTTLTGLGTLSTTGSTSIGSSGGSLAIIGGASWANSGTVTLTGSVLAGTAKLSNAAGGVFALATDGAGILANGGRSSFGNAGLLSKTGGVGTSEIDSTLNSTGTINVASGTLLLTANATLSGQLCGSGTLQLSANNNQINGLNSSIANLLELLGGTSTVLTSSSLGNLLVDQGAVLALVGSNLVRGATTLAGGAIVSGSSGTLNTAGAVAVTGDGQPLSFLAGASWVNFGTVSDAGAIQSSGAATITINNTVGSEFDLLSDAAGMVGGGAPTIFNNGGLLAKLGGAGVSLIAPTITSAGTINVASGTIELTGGGSISGVVTGGGVLLFGGGAFTIGGGAVLGSGGVAISGARVTVNGRTSLDLAGIFSFGSGSFTLGQGATLELDGAAAINGGSTMAGPGNLVTTGSVTVGGPGFGAWFTNGMLWTNSGTVMVCGQIDKGGSSPVVFDNEAGGVFNLINDTAGVLDVGSISGFGNQGLLEKSGGTGTSTLYSRVNSSGTLIAASGTLAIGFPATLSGTAGGAGGLLVVNKVTSAGQLTITDNGSAVSIEVTNNQGAVWTNTGTVSDGGLVKLGGIGSGGAATLNNAAGGVWDFTTSDGGFSAGGQVSLSNAGTLAMIGAGSVAIACNLTNSGLIDAASGTLQVLGIVGGSGQMEIDAGATLELGQPPAGGQTFEMDGSGATLRLDTPTSVATPIQGLGVGDGIDLAGIQVSDATISGQLLSVTAGGSTYTFASSQALSGVQAVISQDGLGGSLVTLQPVDLVLASAAFLPARTEPAAFGALDSSPWVMDTGLGIIDVGLSRNGDAGVAWPLTLDQQTYGVHLGGWLSTVVAGQPHLLVPSHH